MNRSARKLFVAVLVAVAFTTISSADVLPPDRPIEEVVDFYIDVKMAQHDVIPAPLCDDANLIRRTMLDLVGRIPTVVEVQEFVESDDPQKRQKLVDRLIGSPAFARHQANEFDSMLMYGTGGSMRDYLLVAFQEHRGWDTIFRDALVGHQTDDVQKHAVEFVKARVNDLDKLTNEASVAFFGINVSCAKCHDHPFVSSWTQDHFYGMKSFFSRTFDNGGFLGERDYGIVKYKTTADEERTARLMFLSGNTIEEPETKEPSDKEKKEEKKRLEAAKKKKEPPPAPKFSRRAKLVEVALQPGENEYLARAVVNRVWDRLFGRGLVTPVDQMHPENRPTHPLLLHWLARDFIEHDYDLRRLIRGLVLSQTYARSSRWNGDSRPVSQYFAVAQVRPLTPQQYATTLRIASMNPDVLASDMNPDDFAKRIEEIENSARGLANLFDQPQEDFQISVDEALLLSNSERIERELLRDSGDSLIGKLNSIEDPRELVEMAVWTVCSRPPTDEETQSLVQFVLDRNDRRRETCKLIVWALLGASETRFNY